MWTHFKTPESTLHTLGGILLQKHRHLISLWISGGIWDIWTELTDGARPLCPSEEATVRSPGKGSLSPQIPQDVCMERMKSLPSPPSFLCPVSTHQNPAQLQLGFCFLTSDALGALSRSWRTEYWHYTSWPMGLESSHSELDCFLITLHLHCLYTGVSPGRLNYVNKLFKWTLPLPEENL